MFCHEGVVDESLDEESEGDDIEDENVEYALSVVLEVGGEHVPLFEEPVPVPLRDGVHGEALHPRHVCVGVQVVLPRALAVQANGQEVSL